jgi:uncharacterized membrane protein YjjP (DUF1212 family)
MVNYLFVFCIHKVSYCIFDKQRQKKKGLNRIKRALSNDLAKVWFSSKNTRHLPDMFVLLDLAGPSPVGVSGKTRFIGTETGEQNRVGMKTDRAEQRKVTRLCIQCALLLLQHGAESALVEELSTRLGIALGMDSVESAISSNAIVLTTFVDGECLTSTRKNSDRGINMHVVTEVQHIVIMAEHKLLDAQDVEKRFSQIKPLRYPRWLVVTMVGLSCACFCKLNNGGWDGAFVTLCASTFAMYIRQLLTHHSMHPQINFCLTAFVATTLSGLMLRLPAFQQTSSVAMAASVLLLVPGFPLINAVADMFKGHINTGLARWAIASLLTLATCVGVVMAMTLWGLRGWA